MEPLNSASRPKKANPNPVTTYGFIILLKNTILSPSKTTNPKKKKNIETPKNILEVVIFAIIQYRLQPVLILQLELLLVQDTAPVNL